MSDIAKSDGQLILQLTRERAALKEALQGTLWILGGGHYSRLVLDQLKFCRALLAKLDAEAS